MSVLSLINQWMMMDGVDDVDLDAVVDFSFLSGR